MKSYLPTTTTTTGLSYGNQSIHRFGTRTVLRVKKPIAERLSQYNIRFPVERHLCNRKYLQLNYVTRCISPAVSPNLIQRRVERQQQSSIKNKKKRIIQ